MTDRPIDERIILDLCGGTGAWSKPYADAGYDVRLVTLPDHDVRTYLPPDDVYGILAAPPCTEFSLAKGALPRDFEGSLKIVRACLDIIWRCWLQSQFKFWCLENPRGFLRQFLGKPPLTVWYWWFGDTRGKPTDLWGYYEKPKQVYTEPPALWDKIKSINGLIRDRAEVRTITPPGFAQAFFAVNP